MKFLIRFFSLLKTIYRHPYNQKKPALALFRMIRWQIDKHVYAKDESIYTFWGNRKIICFKDSLESMWAVYNAVMDWEEFNFISAYLKQSDCVFDIGSNIGIYALWMSRFIKDGKIVCFEPDPTNYERCKRQIDLNRLDSITIEKIALGQNEVMMKFSQGKDGENHLICNDAHEDKIVNVQVMKLDDYCLKNGIDYIDFLKIDIEGAELFAMQGASNLLSKRKIRVIQFELLDHANRFGIKASDLIEFFNEYGYSIYRFNVKKTSLYPVKQPGDFSQNMFAIADIELTRHRLLNQPPLSIKA
jgi:FkbM family methyltransferase